MGGFGTLAKDAAEMAGEDLIKGFKSITKEEGAQNWVRSMKAVLNKSETGKVMADFLEKTFEPEVKRSAQANAEFKIKNGVPKHIAYKDAGLQAFHDTRKAYLGKNDEGIIKFVDTVRKKEGLARANNLADAMNIYFHDGAAYWRKTKVQGLIGSNVKGKPLSLADVGITGHSTYTPPKEVEKNLKAMMGWMYTPLIAIPHVGQVGNIILDNSFASTAKAMSDYSGAVAKYGNKAELFFKDVIDSGALFDEFNYQAQEDAKGGGIARTLFHHPGFNWVRRQEITLAALTAKHAANEAAEKLKFDGGDKWARYTLQKLGINISELGEKGYNLTPEDIKNAMFNGANRTIFLRSELATPYAWEESRVARIMAQYKHYAFRQGSFIGNVLWNSVKEGGMGQTLKSLGLLSVMFPAIGELVKSAEQGAQGQDPFARDKKGTAEYFDALGHAGGMGIYQSLFRAGMWNYGRGYLEGPLASTAEDIFIGLPTHIYKGVKYTLDEDDDKASRQWKAAAKLAVSKLGIPGRIIGSQLKNEKDTQ